MAPRSTLTHVWYRETERGAGWKWEWVGDKIIGCIRTCDLIHRLKGYSSVKAKQKPGYSGCRFCLKIVRFYKANGMMFVTVD